jgi:hypothetical protein
MKECMIEASACYRKSGVASSKEVNVPRPGALSPSYGGWKGSSGSLNVHLTFSPGPKHSVACKIVVEGNPSMKALGKSDEGVAYLSRRRKFDVKYTAYERYTHTFPPSSRVRKGIETGVQYHVIKLFTRQKLSHQGGPGKMQDGYEELYIKDESSADSLEELLTTLPNTIVPSSASVKKRASRVQHLAAEDWMTDLKERAKAQESFNVYVGGKKVIEFFWDDDMDVWNGTRVIDARGKFPPYRKRGRVKDGSLMRKALSDVAELGHNGKVEMKVMFPKSMKEYRGAAPSSSNPWIAHVQAYRNSRLAVASAHVVAPPHVTEGNLRAFHMSPTTGSRPHATMRKK